MSTLLIVEDNEDNLDMISRRLVKRGFEILVARNGQEGVDQAIGHCPDLVLMDIDLPVLDGYAATRAIKAERRTAHIPIIALSANAMAGDAERGLAAGCDAYLTKPVNMAELLEMIARFLPSSS
jgi:CheY-like chemotaxis protein